MVYRVYRVYMAYRDYRVYKVFMVIGFMGFRVKRVAGLGWQTPWGFPETMGQYNRRSCFSGARKYRKYQ